MWQMEYVMDGECHRECDRQRVWQRCDCSGRSILKSVPWHPLSLQGSDISALLVLVSKRESCWSLQTKFVKGLWGFSDEILLQITPRLPGIMFNSESFPFNQVAQFPIDDFTVQDLLYNPFLFSIYNLREWRGKGVSSMYRVFWGQCQLDYIENRVKVTHGGWKSDDMCYFQPSRLWGKA